MKSPVAKFLVTVFITTIFCTVLQVIWNQRVPENYRCKMGFFILAVISTSVSLIYLILVNSIKAAPSSFILKYMATTVFKFLFFIATLMVLLFVSGDNKTALILHFLFYYLVFNIMEAGFLYHVLRKHK